MTTLPDKHSNEGKKVQVKQMFDSISRRYDFLNHFLTLGIDKSWRTKAIKTVNKDGSVQYLLDIATGTGDLAFEAMKQNIPDVLGLDLSPGMLEIARDKAKKNTIQGNVEFVEGDSENLPFNDNTFDAVTVGYGVRNFENMELGLKEILRVLKPKGRLVVLELSKPEKTPIKQIYHLYFHFILPSIGKLVSRSQNAYSYLPESVDNFPYGSRFLDLLHTCGYHKSHLTPLMMGISTIYYAEKPEL